MNIPNLKGVLPQTRGLIPGEDAPDIIANTFLAGITEKQMDAVGRGFLAHRESELQYLTAQASI